MDIILKQIIEQSQENIIYLDLNYNILIINEPAANYYQWNEKTVLGKNYINLCKKSYFTPLIQKHSSFHEHIINVADKIKHKNNMIKKAYWKISTIQKNNQPIGFLLLGHNIPNNEQNLHEKNLVEFVNMLPGNIFWKDKNGYYLGCNKSFLSAFKLQGEKNITGKNDVELFGEKYGKNIQNNDKIVLHRNAVTYFEESIKKQNCSKTFIVAKLPLKDNKEKTIGIIGIALEISRLKKQVLGLNKAKMQAEQKTEDVTTYLNNIISCTPGSIYWKDRNGRYLGCNTYMLKNAGLHSQKEIIGKSDEKLWPAQATLLHSNDSKVLAGKTITTLETVKLPNGNQKYFTVVKMPLRDNNNNIVGIIGNSLEITELKETEKALQEAKTKAEAANAAKTEFLANMSHDLRTPLSGILGMSEILEHRIQPENIKFVKDIETSGKRLLSIVNEIIDFIQIETGKLPLRKQKFDLKEMVEGLMHLMSIQARQQSVALTTHYSKNIPRHLIGDKDRTHRILLNLINNAVKFTHKGYVKTTINYTKKKSNAGEFTITVEDTGIGIPENKYDVIFERFSRLNPAYQGLYKGAGLGLRIVKQLAGDLSGTINVKSKVGKGSTFTCTLPFELDTSKQKTIKEPKATNNEKYNARILLVEDEKMCQFVAKTFLDEMGCSIDFAESGEAALQAVEKNQYDLILMDIGLPDIPGYKVTEQIRQTTNKNKKTPIIALTAHVLKDEQEKCLASGVTDVLKKPIDKNSLLKALHDFTLSK